MARSRIVHTLSRSTLVRRSFGSGPWGDSSIPNNGSLSSFGNAGVGGWEGISIILACVKAIFEDFLVPQFKAYDGDPTGPKRPIADQPIIVVEPFGPDVDVALGMAQLAVSRLLRGNFYCAYADVDRFGLPTLLTILDPDKVKPERNPATGVKELRVGYGDRLKPGEYVHGQGLTVPGAIAGLDVLTAQRAAFEAVANVEAYGRNFFGSGGSPAGILSVPGNPNREKLRAMGQQWDAAHMGVGNAHRPAVLGGGAKWQPLSVTPENAQFLETRRFNREELCGLFGVPLQRVQAIVENASQGGGRGIESIDESYVAHTLLAIGSSIESVWNRLVPGGQGTFTKFDWREFLRTDAATRATIAAQHRLGGIRTRDEIRAEEGWGPLPDGKGSDPDTPLNSNKGPADAPTALPEAPAGEPATILPVAVDDTGSTSAT